MPRKNDRVRVRNIPKAAQPKKGERRTSRAQLDADSYGLAKLQPSRAKRREVENALATG